MKKFLAVPVLLVLFMVLFQGVSSGEVSEALEPKPLELGAGIQGGTGVVYLNLRLMRELTGHREPILERMAEDSPAGILLREAVGDIKPSWSLYHGFEGIFWTGDDHRAGYLGFGLQYSRSGKIPFRVFATLGPVRDLREDETGLGIHLGLDLPVRIRGTTLELGNGLLINTRDKPLWTINLGIKF